jgi:hypothetical protein
MFDGSTCYETLGLFISDLPDGGQRFGEMVDRSALCENSSLDD